jgi:hypothetical protein
MSENRAINKGCSLHLNNSTKGHGVLSVPRLKIGKAVLIK